MLCLCPIRAVCKGAKSKIVYLLLTLVHPGELVLEDDELVNLPEGLKERPHIGVLHGPRNLADEELHSVGVLLQGLHLLLQLLHAHLHIAFALTKFMQPCIR